MMKKYVTLIILLICGCIYGDNHPFSQLPPGNIKPENTPMFVCFGFDDNGYVDGVKWFADYVRDKKNNSGTNNKLTFDNSPVRSTFFITAGYADDVKFVNAGGQTKQQVLDSWKVLYKDGHEIANHTWTHPHGAALSVEQWKEEITLCNDFFITQMGMKKEEIKGFRTPFLEYSPNTMVALKELGFIYDCSIEFGFDGWVPIPPDSGFWNGMSNPETHKKLFWPHTLDKGSPPGNAAKGNPKVAGLWEVPVFTYLKNGNNGVITGFDFNMWKTMDKKEYLETMKRNFDFRRMGNRNPFTVNTHTDYYTVHNEEAKKEFTKSTSDERRRALEEFLDYTLSFPETRVVSYDNMLQWMKNPIPLGTTSAHKKQFHSAQVKKVNIQSVNSNLILTGQSGIYTVKIFSLKGEVLLHTKVNLMRSNHAVSLPRYFKNKTLIVELSDSNLSITKMIRAR